jgi:DNA-binding response OmpR family regulator
MNTLPVVLLYGHDEMLLLTRSLIFKHAGYGVSIARELKDIAPMLGKGHVGLIVLCYSLSRTECVTAGFIAKNRSDVPTLLMTADGASRDRYLGDVADALFDSMLGAEALLQKVARMLHVERQRVLAEAFDGRRPSTGAA